ncbi:MAG: hypothetical protein QGH33_19060, partial [Pirellulaceae bacterium]|nr:hypothetical protein [Pirellulaceae bacterium]
GNTGSSPVGVIFFAIITAGMAAAQIRLLAKRFAQPNRVRRDSLPLRKLPFIAIDAILVLSVSSRARWI